MNKLKDLRDEIDSIDDELIKLFLKRMDVVEKIKDYKQKNNLEIYDKNREDEIFKFHLSKIEDEKLKDFVEEFINELLNLSKLYQKKFRG